MFTKYNDLDLLELFWSESERAFYNQVSQILLAN
ncbi:hypothetical protein IMAU80128_03454 [Lactiplantibacillus plantarum]|nr:hypothetical protein [Lactiplantibacillus plantarum]